MLVLLVYLGKDQSHTLLCAMYLQGFVERWRGGAADLLNCFSRLIGLISLIEIIGATTQCQGICGFLKHFPCKYCAVKSDDRDVNSLAVTPMSGSLTQRFCSECLWTNKQRNTGPSQVSMVKAE